MKLQGQVSVEKVAHILLWYCISYLEYVFDRSFKLKLGQSDSWFANSRFPTMAISKSVF